MANEKDEIVINDLMEGQRMSNIGPFSRCPDCWSQGLRSHGLPNLIEKYSSEFVYCKFHGEMTISYFVSRMNEVEKERLDGLGVVVESVTQAGEQRRKR